MKMRMNGKESVMVIMRMSLFNENHDDDHGDDDGDCYSLLHKIINTHSV